MYAWASYGPADGLSPRASPGHGNARLAGSISCKNLSCFPISDMMQIELVLAIRRLIFVEI